MKIYTNDLVKGHSDFKVKCLTFGLYTQVSDSGPLGPLVGVMCCKTHLSHSLRKGNMIVITSISPNFQISMLFIK